MGILLVPFLHFFAYKYDLIQNMSSFMLGDFSMIMSGNYELMFITIPILALAFFFANKFTIAGMGEDFAKKLRVELQAGC